MAANGVAAERNPLRERSSWTTRRRTETVRAAALSCPPAVRRGAFPAVAGNRRNQSHTEEKAGIFIRPKRLWDGIWRIPRQNASLMLQCSIASPAGCLVARRCRVGDQVR